MGGYYIDEYDRAESSITPVFTSDCGYKLDFDGPLMTVSSRFWPPKQAYGEMWDGGIQVLFMDNKLLEKEFSDKTFEGLTSKIIKYTQNLDKTIKKILDDNIDLLKDI